MAKSNVSRACLLPFYSLSFLCIFSFQYENSASAFQPTSKILSPIIANFDASNGLLSKKESTRTTSATEITNNRGTIRLNCGLVAAIDDIWSANVNPMVPGDVPLLSDESTLDSTTSILTHRGPDGQTIASGKIGANGNEARWSMGHTRLAIVDPNNRNADMPFQLTFEDENKVIKLAANGEIYNHVKVFKEMQEKDGWPHDEISKSDCEVIGHAFAKYGGPEMVKKLDGMFAFVVFEENTQDGTIRAFAARDPVGIKPLYYGRSKNANPDSNAASAYIFSSELKALVGHVEPSSVVAIPPGHYWTPEEGLVCYYNPDWLRKDDFAPWKEKGHEVTDDEIREAFTKAVDKRMMADVDYGFFLSGGVDSAVVSNILLPLYRDAELKRGGEYRRIPTYTVGMEDSPDVMAAKAVVESLGGDKYIDHKIRYFTPDEVFGTVPKIIYHMETYEAELIRSSIPNWFLAEKAAQDVKMVLTGEGSDELFAGYLYFQDAENPEQLQNELKRIYGMLGNINLHRTDRMTMAHGLEARVPFLDTEFTKLVMSVDPKYKMVDPEAVRTNSRGREKTFLRELFEGPNANGDSIPRPVLWRAKAMQCEGVGEDWVSILQSKIAELVTDEEMENAATNYPVNTPQTKEELYYRRIFDEHFHGMEHVVKLWEGGGRAMGAAWKSDMYTREGLKNVNLLTHALQDKAVSKNVSGSPSATKAAPNADSPALGVAGGTTGSVPKRLSNRKYGWGMWRNSDSRPHSSLYATTMSASKLLTLNETSAGTDSRSKEATEDALLRAKEFGYDDFESTLTTGGDDRTLILTSGTNKYHIRPQPIGTADIFRGSCTGNPPTIRGYEAARELFRDIDGLSGAELDYALHTIFAEQRERISKILNLPEGSGVVLCPSGSDAEYLPLAIARQLHPDTKIYNSVSQLNEIGAGSAPAGAGDLFSTHSPHLGKRLEGEPEKLDGFENIYCTTTCARNKKGGILDASDNLDDFVQTAWNNGGFPITHGVFGGKTGLRDKTMPSSLEGGNKSLGVVDACQGRFSLEELHGWLDQDSIVLFTGSKFYQAPPFCGAVIIPPTIAKKLASSPAPERMLSSTGLGAFLTDKELPQCLHNWKPHLRQKETNNVGLALRWEAGLAAMEALQHVDDSVREKAVTTWANSVETMVRKEIFLDPWCIERSIVSIRVARNGGGWLSMSECRDLYRWMSMDVSGLVPDATREEKKALSKATYIGQPVNVSESHAIVRIALGVESLLQYIDDPIATLQDDHLVVQKMAAIGKHFSTLKNSGI